MTISRRMNYLLENALREALRDQHIEVYSLNDFDLEAPQHYGVNWCAMGTKPVEDAKVYAKWLERAAEIAEALNKLEIVVDYLEETHVLEEKKAEWPKWTVSFIHAIETADADIIKSAIEKTYRVFFGKEV